MKCSIAVSRIAALSRLSTGLGLLPLLPFARLEPASGRSGRRTETVRRSCDRKGRPLWRRRPPQQAVVLQC
jgi:hypothetical protein